MNDAPEEWRDIPGHEGRYQVSSLGRFIGPRGRSLKPHVDHQGYARVGLHMTDGTGRTVMAHRLVAAAFLGPGVGLDVDHINGDRADNRVENLRYLTHAENVKASAAAGRSMRGEAHVCATITEVIAKQIIADYAPSDVRGFGRKNPRGMKGLARQHGTTLRVVRGILNGETWKHLPRTAQISRKDGSPLQTGGVS